MPVPHLPDVDAATVFELSDDSGDECVADAAGVLPSKERSAYGASVVQSGKMAQAILREKRKHDACMAATHAAAAAALKLAKPSPTLQIDGPRLRTRYGPACFGPRIWDTRPVYGLARI